MDRASADRVIAESFSRPSATPSGWRDDRDTYIAEEQQALRASQIDPIPVKAVADIVAQQHYNCDSIVREYVAIARAGDTWLLYSTETDEFAKAFGSDTSEPLGLLGFSSDDALAEWLG